MEALFLAAAPLLRPASAPGGLCRVAEVGIVGIDQNALVAREAIVDPQLGTDLARHTAIALPPVAWIADGFGNQQRSIEQAGLVNVHRNTRSRSTPRLVRGVVRSL